METVAEASSMHGATIIVMRINGICHRKLRGSNIIFAGKNMPYKNKIYRFL